MIRTRLLHLPGTLLDLAPLHLFSALWVGAHNFSLPAPLPHNTCSIALSSLAHTNQRQKQKFPSLLWNIIVASVQYLQYSDVYIHALSPGPGVTVLSSIYNIVHIV